jgi:two-component system NtrC family sensor kinase
MKQIVETPGGTAPLSSDDLLHLSRLITVGELTACFAHEVTNPLMLIRGHLRLVEDQLPQDHPIRMNFEVIERASRRIEDMTKRLLDFSRKRKLRAENCDVTIVIEDAIRFVQPYLQTQNIEVQLNIDDHLPHVLVDRWHLVQGLVNLFQNAADAMSQCQRRILTVGVERQGKNLRVSVVDTGHGIATNDLPRVFDPFFTTKGERGTGLGLYITRRVVEEHRGAITVETSDRGTIFVISLPL